MVSLSFQSLKEVEVSLVTPEYAFVEKSLTSDEMEVEVMVVSCCSGEGVESDELEMKHWN